MHSWPAEYEATGETVLVGHEQSCAKPPENWWRCRSSVWRRQCCPGWWLRATNHQEQTLSHRDPEVSQSTTMSLHKMWPQKTLKTQCHKQHTRLHGHVLQPINLIKGEPLSKTNSGFFCTDTVKPLKKHSINSHSAMTIQQQNINTLSYKLCHNLSINTQPRHKTLKLTSE